jgi:hypothetical protein
MWPKSREVLRPSDGGLVRVVFEEICCLSDAKAISADENTIIGTACTDSGIGR